jgi:hypothetical protein
MVGDPGEAGQPDTKESPMKKERSRAIRRRLGPIGMSLIASALTAAGFAAFSIADSGGGDGKGDVTETMAVPAPGGPGVMFRERLSDEDRQALEEFRQCMEQNGAPAPPQRIDPSDGPPKPPSAAEMEKIQKAHEACKDKLPQDLQNAGPPGIGFHCGPPPGAPPGDRGGQNQEQSNEAGSDSSGTSS